MGRTPCRSVCRPSSTHAVRAVNVRLHSIPVSFGSSTTRDTIIGSTTSIRNGPTAVSAGSPVARFEAWKACCSPSRTTLNPQSMIPLFGYRPIPIAK